MNPVGNGWLSTDPVSKRSWFSSNSRSHPRRALVLVRIMPYRTLENRIDGVVITFSNITAAKALEAQLRQTQAETGKSKKEGTS